jgi:hypothetical protein
VSFDGVGDDESGTLNDLNLPADSDDFRSSWEIEDAPSEEFRGYQIIARAMSNDIPADVFDTFAESRYGDSPAFSGHIDDVVESDRLEDLIAALEARGYKVIQ